MLNDPTRPPSSPPPRATFVSFRTNEWLAPGGWAMDASADLTGQEEHLFSVAQRQAASFRWRDWSNERCRSSSPYNLRTPSRSLRRRSGSRTSSPQSADRRSRGESLRPVGRDPQGAWRVGSASELGTRSGPRTTSRVAPGHARPATPHSPSYSDPGSGGEFDIFFLTGIGEVSANPVAQRAENFRAS